jgi:phosphohistidine phosphatase
MGKEMVKHNVVPQRIISSSAVRARTTAEIFASELSYDLAEIVVTDEIYGVGTTELLEMIQGFDDELDKVMLVGHNPTVTDLANGLAQCNIHNVPTCGVLVIGFQVEQWSDIEDGKGNLFAFAYPKKLKE